MSVRLLALTLPLFLVACAQDDPASEPQSASTATATPEEADGDRYAGEGDEAQLASEAPPVISGTRTSEMRLSDEPVLMPVGPRQRSSRSKPADGRSGAPASKPDEVYGSGSAAPLREREESNRQTAQVITGADARSADGLIGLEVADPAPAQPLARNAESYTQYGVNDMTLSEGDRFSTFSIDVDTASYSISRRKLQSGALPPTAAVRVEEFINAMDYDYSAPEPGSNGDAPFAVHMEAAPSPLGQGHHLLRVGVKGMEPEGERAPLHLTFLVDSSGSMSSMDKIGLVRQSLHTLSEQLGPRDSVAIATYAGSTTVVLEPTKGSDQGAIHTAIDRLGTGGGTNMGSGMENAYQLASQRYVHGAENRVIVLSDGDANIGRTSHEEILRTVEHYAEEGITLTTVGFGMGNYKDTMMEQLANQGDGNYFYIDSMNEAEEVFSENFVGNMQVIAKDVKIQVEFNPDAVMAYRLIGYENRDIADKDFRNDRVDAGEIGAGHSVTALYDVILSDAAAAGEEQELATVRLRAKTPGPDRPASEWATVFDGELLHDELASASADLRIATGAALFAELLRGSPYTAELSYADVADIVRGASRGTDEDRELLELIRTAGSLSGEKSSLVRR